VRIVPRLGGSLVEVTPGATATHTTVREQTLAAGGDLVLQAGRDLTLTGVGVTAGGAAALLATRDLTLDTVRAASSFSSGDTRNYIRTEQVTHTLTTLDIGGALALRAGDFSLPALTSNLNLDSAAPAAAGNINITSAQLRAGGDLTLAATGDIDITAVKDRDFSDIQSTTKGFMRSRTVRDMHDDETVLGATLQTAGNLALQAGDPAGSGGTGVPPVGLSDMGDPPMSSGNIHLTSAYLNAAGAATLAAAGDLTLTTLDEHHESLHVVTEKKFSLTSNLAQGVFAAQEGRKTTDGAAAGLAIGTLVSADSVSMQSGRDLALHGSQIVADQDIALRAGRDLAITAATNTYAEEHSLAKSTAGMISNNAFSLTFGVKKETTELAVVSTEAAGSLIGSTAGRVDLYAGRDATIIGSDLFSQNGLSISAENISLLAAQNTTTTDYRQTFSQSGVTVQIKSSIIDAGLQIYDSAKRGTEVRDDRLKGLYAAKTAYAAKDAYAGMSKLMAGKNTTGDKAAAAGASIQIAVSVGSSQSKSESHTTDTEYIGSTLQTAGDLTLTARGDTGSAGILPADGSAAPASTSNLNSAASGGGGNIAIAGSDLTAQNITLTAANDILIESTADTHSLRSENENSSWAVGVAFGVGKNSAGFSVFAEGALGEGHENADGTVHANSHLDAADTLAIATGRDATIAGAVLTGETVTADIGRDLTLQSRQDTDTYESEQMQLSAKGEGGTGGGGGSLSYSHSETEASHASVVEQTGIFAGAGGFDINVGGNTSLTGAVIASEASDPAQNRLSTETISFSDIQNHSEYDAKSISVSVSAGSGGGSVSGGMSHQSDSVTGVTKSAIADADITVRSDYDENGTRLTDSLAGLSRDTANANAGAVENIFNPQQLAEQQEMAQVAGEVGFRAAGDLSNSLSRDAREQKQAADTLEKAALVGTETEKQELLGTASELREQAAPALAAWGEGGYAKTLLHAGVGALQASLGGGDVLSGALGAGVTEAARGYDIAGHVLGEKSRDANGNKTNTTKAIEQLFSIAVGSAAGAVGGDAMTGGGVAWDAEKYNRQLHDDELATIKAKAREKAAESLKTPEGEAILKNLTLEVLESNPGLDKMEAEKLAKARYDASYEARYMLAGMNLVHAGDEVPRWMMRLGTVTKQLSALGGDYTAEQTDLKSTGLFQYDTVVDGAADRIASGRASFDNYKTYVLIPGALPEDGLVGAYKSNPQSLAIEAAYNREEEGGYHNAQNTINYITPLIGMTYENPSKVFEALGKDSKTRWVGSIAKDMIVDTGVHIGETLGHAGANIQLTESGGNPWSVDSYRENVQNINIAARSLEDPFGKAGEYELDDPDIKAAKFLGEVAITIAGPAAIGKVGNLVRLSKVGGVGIVAEEAALASRTALAGETGALARAAESEIPTLFRGTSEGFPGSPGLQKIGVTPTSTDPVVASVFATKSSNYGKGVFHIATKESLQGVDIIPGNILSAAEREVGVAVTPTVFATEKTAVTITAQEARVILKEMGVTVPEVVTEAGADLTRLIESMPKLNTEQTQQFIKRAAEVAAKRSGGGK
jgi:filamentous hemagglutinin